MPTLRTLCIDNQLYDVYFPISIKDLLIKMNIIESPTCIVCADLFITNYDYKIGEYDAIFFTNYADGHFIFDKEIVQIRSNNDILTFLQKRLKIFNDDKYCFSLDKIILKILRELPFNRITFSAQESGKLKITKIE